MWSTLSLKFKLTFGLILFQTSVLGVMAYFLILWVNKSKFHELEARLDVYSDFAEDAVKLTSSGDFRFDQSGESFKELSRESGLYIELSDDTGKILDTTGGVEPIVRGQIQSQFRYKKNSGKNIFFADGASLKWILQSEKIEKNSGNKKSDMTLNVSMNAEKTISEISDFKVVSLFYIVAAIMVSATGTYALVSVSTQNIRNFARQIKKLKPPHFADIVAFKGTSSEEILLHSSFISMVSLVRESSSRQRLFIANAAHEIKNPLAGIYAALEVLLGENRTPQHYQSTCQEIFEEMKVLKNLCEHLFELEQLESHGENSVGFFTSSLGDCALEIVLKNSISKWSVCASKKGVKIEFVTPKDVDGEMRVQGSSKQWESIVGNLLENSIKYGKKGGSIEVELKVHTPQRYQVVIQDDGIGMCEDDVAKLGTPFFRVDESRTGSGSFGLGFALVKKMLVLLDGQIGVESKLGRGTKVTVYAKPSPLVKND